MGKLKSQGRALLEGHVISRLILPGIQGTQIIISLPFQYGTLTCTVCSYYIWEA